MQSRAGTGLVRFVLFLLCASLVLAVKQKRGCETLPSNGQCPAAEGYNGGQLKCARCQKSLKTLMNDELLHPEKEPRLSGIKSCEQKIDQSAGKGPDYGSSSKGGLEGCFTSGIMLYDGAVECHAVTGVNAAGALANCIGAPTGLYSCLCDNYFDDSHIDGLQPCFQLGGAVPVMATRCPPETSTKKRGAYFVSRYVPAQNNDKKQPKRGKSKKVAGRGGTRRATEGDDSNNDAEDGSGDTSADGSNYDDDDDYDHEIDWPDPNDQFSPVLQVSKTHLLKDSTESAVLIPTHGIG